MSYQTNLWKKILLLCINIYIGLCVKVVWMADCAIPSPTPLHPLPRWFGCPTMYRQQNRATEAAPHMARTISTKRARTKYSAVGNAFLLERAPRPRRGRRIVWNLVEAVWSPIRNYVERALLDQIMVRIWGGCISDCKSWRENRFAPTRGWNWSFCIVFCMQSWHYVLFRCCVLGFFWCYGGGSWGLGHVAWTPSFVDSHSRSAPTIVHETGAFVTTSKLRCWQSGMPRQFRSAIYWGKASKHGYKFVTFFCFFVMFLQ